AFPNRPHEPADRNRLPRGIAPGRQHHSKGPAGTGAERDHPGKPSHRRLGRDVASDGNLPVRLVADSGRGEALRSVGRHAGPHRVHARRRVRDLALGLAGRQSRGAAAATRRGARRRQGAPDRPGLNTSPSSRRRRAGGRHEGLFGSDLRWLSAEWPRRRSAGSLRRQPGQVQVGLKRVVGLCGGPRLKIHHFAPRRARINRLSKLPNLWRTRTDRVGHPAIRQPSLREWGSPKPPWCLESSRCCCGSPSLAVIPWLRDSYGIPPIFGWYLSGTVLVLAPILVFGGAMAWRELPAPTLSGWRRRLRLFPIDRGDAIWTIIGLLAIVIASA